MAVLLILSLSCTPNLGGDNIGWAPLSVSFPDSPGEPARIYVASQMDSDLEDLGTQMSLDLSDDERRVKIRALEDFGSGTPRVVWTYPPLGSGSGLEGVFGPPAISKELGLVFVGAVDGNLYALSIDTGDELGGWKRAVRSDPSEDAQPLISGPVLTDIIRSDTGPSTVVLVGSEDGNLYAFNAASGDELPWSPFRTSGRIWSTPTVQNSIAFFGSQDHNIYAVDLRDGKELWRYETGGPVVGSPLIFAGNVIVGSFDKKLYALDADDGDLEWTFSSDNWFWTAPVTDGETIFAPSMDGYVYALDPSSPAAGETKSELWRHNMESPVVSTPALVPLGLVVAAVDGQMKLLSASPSNLTNGDVISGLDRLDDAGIKSPLVVGTPPDPSLGVDVQSLSIIQRHSVFVSGDNGIVRRMPLTEGQDYEPIWCFDSSKHRQCN